MRKNPTFSVGMSRHFNDRRRTKMKTYLLTALAVCGLATSSMLALTAGAERGGVHVRAPFVAVDINIGADGKATDDTPGRMSELLGMTVKNTKGQQLGTVEDIVIGTTSGQIRYAALSFGGFLGIGDQLVAVPWESLRFQHDVQRDEKYFLLDADRKALGDFPRIESNKWPDHLALGKTAESGASSGAVPELKPDKPVEKAKPEPEVR
jgi:sporulation protein YlmC with PRC-barrel domain